MGLSKTVWRFSICCKHFKLVASQTPLRGIKLAWRPEGFTEPEASLPCVLRLARVGPSAQRIHLRIP